MPTPRNIDLPPWLNPWSHNPAQEALHDPTKTIGISDAPIIGPVISTGQGIVGAFGSMLDAVKWLIAHIPQMLLIILGFAMFAMGALIISKGPRTAIQRAVPGIGSNTYTFKYEGRPNAETS